MSDFIHWLVTVCTGDMGGVGVTKIVTNGDKGEGMDKKFLR